MKLTIEEQRRRWREKSRQYYHKHTAKQLEKSRQYREQNKDKLAARHRAYYEKNREEILARRKPDKEKKREYERQYRAAHKEARLASGKKSYRKNWDAIQTRRKARKLAALEAVALRPKPEGCEVCGGTNRISFDHCHQRGVFRGWLCHGCNCALGYAADDPNRLRKLIAYLERTKDLISPQMTLPL